MRPPPFIAASFALALAASVAALPARALRDASGSGSPQASQQDGHSTQPPADGKAKEKPESGKPHTAAEDNPFPEAVSKHAAAAAGASAAPAASPEADQGYSSSNRSRLEGKSGEAEELSSPCVQPKSGPVKVIDSSRAKEDVRVGKFYLQSGNARGAYLRYKDAAACDPTNLDAIFGLAESARGLHHLDEAERNYRTYLAIMPGGSKAKQARKALASLGARK